MAADIDGHDAEDVSTLRDGATSVVVGTALAAVNLFYFSQDTGFTQPTAWVRVVILVLAGLLAAGAWAGWLRGKPAGGGKHLTLILGVLLTALVMYVGVALFVIEQRSQPVDLTLGQELAGREQISVGKKVRSLLEDQLLLCRGGSLAPENVDFEYEFYQDPDRPRADYVAVVVFTAHHGSSTADSLADNFDDAITATLLKDATNVGVSQPIADAPGQLRCGTAAVDSEATPICVYAYGVRSAVFIMPPDEAEPETLASAMLADML